MVLCEADSSGGRVARIFRLPEQSGAITALRMPIRLYRTFLGNTKFSASPSVLWMIFAMMLVVPLEYAHSLRLREKQKEMPINQGGEETQAAMRAHMGG